MYEIKIHRGVICHDNEEWYNWQWRTLQILSQALEKMCVLVGSLWPKYITFELQKYRGVIFHDVEELWKFWSWIGVWKISLEIWQISPGHMKVSKLGLWWDPLAQSRKSMTLKFTGELCVMALNWIKTVVSNLTNFDPSTQKSKKNYSSIISNFTDVDFCSWYFLISLFPRS